MGILQIFNLPYHINLCSVYVVVGHKWFMWIPLEKSFLQVLPYFMIEQKWNLQEFIYCFVWHHVFNWPFFCWHMQHNFRIIMVKLILLVLKFVHASPCVLVLGYSLCIILVNHLSILHWIHKHNVHMLIFCRYSKFPLVIHNIYC